LYYIEQLAGQKPHNINIDIHIYDKWISRANSKSVDQEL